MYLSGRRTRKCLPQTISDWPPSPAAAGRCGWSIRNLSKVMTKYKHYSRDRTAWNEMDTNPVMGLHSMTSPCPTSMQTGTVVLPVSMLLFATCSPLTFWLQTKEDMLAHDAQETKDKQERAESADAQKLGGHDDDSYQQRPTTYSPHDSYSMWRLARRGLTLRHW